MATPKTGLPRSWRASARVPSPKPTTLKPGQRVAWLLALEPGSRITGDALGRGEIRTATDHDVTIKPDGTRAHVTMPARDVHPIYDQPPDVLGAGDVCRFLRIGYERLRQLRERVDFPAPANTSAGPVWDCASIVAWRADRQREVSDHTRALQAWRGIERTGGTPTVAEVARRLRVPYSNAHRWLKTAGVLTTKGTDDG